MSMESSVNYNCLDDAHYLSQFDIEMTYRLNCTVPLPYLREGHVEDFKLPLVPFDEKSAQPVLVSSLARPVCLMMSPARLTPRFDASSQSTRWCMCRATARR